MTILVTGAKGMIGSQLVKGLLAAGHTVVGIDRSSDTSCGGQYFHHMCDLDDKDRLQIIFENYKIDRIIHLAALAHTVGLKKEQLTDEIYYKVNVENAKNIFQMAGTIPVLFISTVDVYGFTKSVVTVDSPVNPITIYGKTKMLAEKECKKLPHFTIFRFSPVYTDEIKRDIQKRYYLKYPKIAYQIGKGTEYEILNVKKAIQVMVDWCSEKPQNNIRIIKDEKVMWTPDYIKAEKAEGRAKMVLRFPQWIVNCGYKVIKGITGENKYTYLLNKAVNPLRTE